MQIKTYPERHTLEHVILPCEFYKHSKDAFICFDKGKRSFLANTYNKETKEGHMKPYRPAEFAVLTRIYGSIVILRLTLPAPKNILECRYIYLCKNRLNEDVMYFTSELSMDGTYYLCAWTKFHSHLLLSMDPHLDEMKYIAENFSQLSGVEKTPGYFPGITEAAV